MSISETVKSYLAQPSRVNILSTSTKDGKANLAMFGSPVLTDDSKIMMVLSDNRTYTNLQQNPEAALLVIAGDQTGMQTEGCRLYPLVLDTERDVVRWDDFCPVADRFPITAAAAAQLRRSVETEAREAARRLAGRDPWEGTASVVEPAAT